MDCVNWYLNTSNLNSSNIVLDSGGAFKLKCFLSHKSTFYEMVIGSVFC